MTDFISLHVEVFIDVQFEILSEGVIKLVDQIAGTPVIQAPDRQISTAQQRNGRQPLLIADFAGDVGRAEQRFNDLQSRATLFNLLIIMLVEWDDFAIRLVRAGARGILYPSAGAAELADAIRTVAARQTYLPPTLQKTLAQRYVAGGPTLIDALTPRELQFMRKLALGMGAREIAEDLGVSVKTADSHRANLLRKLGARNNVELARLALRHGLIAL